MIKKYIFRNGKYFCAYFVFVLIISCLFEKSPSFKSIVNSIGWMSWDETIIFETLLAFIINLVAMHKYTFLLAKNKTASLSIFLLLSLLMANVWFWVSVPPAVYLFFACGGIMS